MAFESRKLNDVEQRYSTHEKEMVVVVHYLQTWRVYLLGNLFMVRIDDVANTFSEETKSKTSTLARVFG